MGEDGRADGDAGGGSAGGPASQGSGDATVGDPDAGDATVDDPDAGDATVGDPDAGDDSDPTAGPSRHPESDRSGALDPTAVDGPVLLFDGVCNLCNGAVQFVIPRDAEGRIRFAPLQSDPGRALLAGWDCAAQGEEAAPESVVLVEAGRCHVRSAAVLRTAAHLDWPWSLVRHLRVVPRPLRDAVYDLLASHRYAVFGRRETCMVPDADVADRFLATDGE